MLPCLVLPKVMADQGPGQAEQPLCCTLNTKRASAHIRSPAQPFRPPSSSPSAQAIVNEISPPSVKPAAPLQMLVTNIDYDVHLGRIAVGRVVGGWAWLVLCCLPFAHQGCWDTLCHVWLQGAVPCPHHLLPAPRLCRRPAPSARASPWRCAPPWSPGPCARVGAPGWLWG